MQVFLKSFDSLTNLELYHIMQLRNEVFVVEQNCPYQDADGRDPSAHHLFYKGDSGKVLAYCRLLPPGIAYPECSIGRVVSSPSVRRTGLGRLLMRQAISFIYDTWWNAETIHISAQLYLRTFYESLGFAATGAVYLEDNIPHITMFHLRNP